MSPETMVYAVESGSYSDHIIHALFATRELAAAYIEAVAAAELRHERAMWGPDSAPYRTAADYSIKTYQLWDKLPLVEDKLGSEQDHRTPPEDGE